MTREEYLRNTEKVYKATRGLFKLTPEDKFDFKPFEGALTIGQVIKHCSQCLGQMAVMGINENWPQMPEGEMLPPAEAFPASASIEEAIAEIDKDWQLMKDEFEKITDDDLNTKTVHAPWDREPCPFVDFMWQTTEHLSNHKMQLFIWLKLTGEKLNTMHLYGMPE